MAAILSVIKSDSVVVSGLMGPPGPQGIPGTYTEEGFVSAANIGGHSVVSINAMGQLVVASCDQYNTNHVIGITINAVVAGNQTLVTTKGSVEHLGWTLNPDQPVFLGINGAITQTVPLTATYQKVIGYAVSATRLTLSIQPSIRL
jgi:hypothetical protein